MDNESKKDIIDIAALSPDTVITEDMLEPKEAVFTLVITNYEKHFEAVKYMGHSELEAHRAYKAIPHNDKVIVKALVTYSDLFKEAYGTEFIISYEVIEVIK